ncbi:MAG: hypothetical protein ACRENO_00145 [Thermodesulfobacteriota bacterium]
MFRNRKSLFFMIVGLILVSIVGVKAVNSGSEENKTTEKNTPELKQVESKYVCMVTDKVFNKEQIPVEVEGKTYYGCCEMCKGNLENDPSIRAAIDPVSGKSVDKALSAIGATSEGNIYYFENTNNLQNFGK